MDSNVNWISIHTPWRTLRDSAKCSSACLRYNDRNSFCCCKFTVANQSRSVLDAVARLACEAAGGIDKRVNVISKDKGKWE